MPCLEEVHDAAAHALRAPRKSIALRDWPSEGESREAVRDERRRVAVVVPHLEIEMEVQHLPSDWGLYCAGNSDRSFFRN